jgi:cytochrome c oxidase cbb3-type subunit 3
VSDRDDAAAGAPPTGAAAPSGPVLQHEYDGIMEFDNPLPFWWSSVFVLTIVFSGVYAWWYHLGGPGDSVEEEFSEQWRGYLARKAEREKLRLPMSEERLSQLAGEPAALERGKAVFAQNCVGCHLADGSGQTGPNLTDDFQLHGVTRMDLFATIRDGVPAKGMLAWGNTLPPADLDGVAAYVTTLRGRRLPGKGPEGGKVGAWP